MIPKEDLEKLRDIHAHLPFVEPMVQVPVAYAVFHEGDIAVGDEVDMIPIYEEPFYDQPENDGLNWDVVGNIGLHNLG